MIDGRRVRSSVIGKMSVRSRGEASEPPTPQAPIALTLANGLRRLMGRGQLNCRLRRVSPTVQLKRYTQLPPLGAPVDFAAQHPSRVVVDGVATCKSRLCPLCVGKWERTRATDITQAVENWGSYRTVFATFTCAHRRDMPLALLHRIQGHAYGALWSGRRGRKAAWRVGGRPESVRAHDLTWSYERGWHPHLHCLLFLQDRRDDLGELHKVLDQRWREQLVSTLRSFKHSLIKIRLGVPCNIHTSKDDSGRVSSFISCDDCRNGRECAVVRERATKLFGVKLIREKDLSGAPVSLKEEARRVLAQLAYFSEKSLQPSVEHGVRVEQVRDEKGIGTYLSKLGAMGFELAGASTKRCTAEAAALGADEWGLGHYGRTDNRIRHYGLWEVGRICTLHRHPLKQWARDAWREVYSATFGTQTITFSDREELGLGPDEYPDERELPDDGEEPDDPKLGELSSILGSIAGKTWDSMAKQQGHGLLIMIEHAHRLGLLEQLPHVDAPVTTWAGTPTTRGPPEPGAPAPTQADREAASADSFMRGKAFWSSVVAQLRARDVPVDALFMEEVREKLMRENASSETDRPARVPHDWLPRETFAEVYARDLAEQEDKRKAKLAAQLAAQGGPR